MVSVLVFLLNFIDYRVGLFTVAEYALFALCLIAIAKGAHVKADKKEMLMLAGLEGCILLSFAANLSAGYFSVVDFLLTFFKFNLYIACIYLVFPLLLKRKKNIKGILASYMTLASLGGVYQVIAVKIFGRENWLIYGLAGHLFGIEGERGMFNVSGMMRARSFYTEPAHFAIHLSLIFAILLLTGYVTEKKIYLHALYVIGIICANSMSGYVIAIALYGLWFLKNFNIKKLFRATAIICTVLVLGFIFVLSNDYLMQRLAYIISGQDGSATVRVLSAFSALEYAPFFGVGLGNNTNYFAYIIEIYQASETGELYNNLVLAIITTGYLGGLFFVLYQRKVFRKNKALFWFLMLTHFAWGRLWTAPMWIFILLYKVAQRKDELEKNGSFCGQYALK